MTKELSYVPFLDDYEKPFSTYDMGLSSSLVSLNFKLLKIEKGQGSKSLFIFEYSEELVEVAQQYWNDELQVKALSYFNALKNIKNRLYSE